jgi:hypothetical protein
MFSELNLVQGLTASQYLSPSLPFCLRFNVGFRHVLYTNAAKLDTEPVASSYSGGVRTRSSSSHFQSARCNPWFADSTVRLIRPILSNPAGSLDSNGENGTISTVQKGDRKMIRIVVQAEVADQIRRSDGRIELVDDQGNRVGFVRRPPTDDEVKFAKSRVGSSGPKFTVDELIAKVKAL